MKMTMTMGMGKRRLDLNWQAHPIRRAKENKKEVLWNRHRFHGYRMTSYGGIGRNLPRIKSHGARGINGRGMVTL